MQNNLHLIPTLAIKTIDNGKYHLKCLEGTVQLSAWQGFQSRKGPYNGLDKREPSDGTVTLTVGEYVAAEEALALSAGQVAAYNFLVEEQNRIKEIILAALLPVYKKLQEEYSDGGDDESWPDVTDASQFKNLIGLSIVHLLDIEKDGVAYTGYEAGCTWDEEHGLGVLMHKDRVIEIGAADTAFDTWAAENDQDPEKAAEALEKARDTPPMPAKKPWWKFW